MIRDFLDRMSFEDRWKPVAEEMQWVMGGSKNPKEHKKILPDYCYPILDAYSHRRKADSRDEQKATGKEQPEMPLVQ
jgi:hypothetical protein